MFKVCSYCNSDNCWGHTNEEKSALDRAKAGEKAATAYYNKIEKLELRIKKLEEENLKLSQALDLKCGSV